MVDVQELRATQQAAQKLAPTGVWSGAPAIAASTVDMKNTSGYTQIVDITAGTVTVVKVNGVIWKSQNANVVAGRFRVPRDGTINITYSVVPTNVVWYYE